MLNKQFMKYSFKTPALTNNKAAFKYTYIIA